MFFASLSNEERWQAAKRVGADFLPRSYTTGHAGPHSAVAANSLQRANIKVVSMANNHAYAGGLEGIAKTIQSLRREGVLIAGASEI